MILRSTLQVGVKIFGLEEPQRTLTKQPHIQTAARRCRKRSTGYVRAGRGNRGVNVRDSGQYVTERPELSSLVKEMGPIQKGVGLLARVCPQ